LKRYTFPERQIYVAKKFHSRSDQIRDIVPGLGACYASDHITVEGRKAVGLLADVYGMTLYQAGGAPTAGERALMRLDELHEVIKNARMTLNAPPRSNAEREVGKVFGLGVLGYMGSVLEIEAVAFKARRPGRGSLRFNETAGTMAKDSVFNAAAVVRRVAGENVSDYDLHVNVIGGGHIDGPSAGTAILVAIISAMRGIPVRQDVGVSGEVSIQGKVKAVGGIVEKIHGARQAGLRRVVLPRENQQETPAPEGIETYFAGTIEEVLDQVLEGGMAALTLKTEPEPHDGPPPESRG